MKQNKGKKLKKRMKEGEKKERRKETGKRERRKINPPKKTYLRLRRYSHSFLAIARTPLERVNVPPTIIASSFNAQ
jgi:hypothetical protein